ncbi:MAG: BatA domain-containing protein [Flavobacteriaceae bacterium]|nr:BatA domain-containing protein [Flavobacteriaceae bacterium]
MQFKHPELLYALFLLLIPIFIHLFQLRRFQKVAFTNVAFLKKVTIQTRKSSQLKKWLTLLIRLLALACIILAFAQPFSASKTALNTEKETVLYIDNSFSMQLKDENGSLLQQTLQQLYSQSVLSENISWFTNDITKKKASIQDFKNDILRVNYTQKQLPLNDVLLKANRLFSENNSASEKRLILISDFQQKGNFPNIENDLKVEAIQLIPKNPKNSGIDTAYIIKKNATTKLKVKMSSTGYYPEPIPVSLYNDKVLVAKTAIDFSENTSQLISFDIDNNKGFRGRIEINDPNLIFDNSLYFTINTPEKIKVLVLNNGKTGYLQRIFNSEEFVFSQQNFENLNYSEFSNQNFLVLNELDTIPESLSTALQVFSENGGSIFIIPSESIEISTYNSLLNKLQLGAISEKVDQEKKITQIVFNHPLYEGVFEKQVINFQYPKVNSFYTISSLGTSVLKFEDSKPFIIQKGNNYLSTAATNKENSSFQNSPLIVPTLYNMAKQSLSLSKLYFEIGKQNRFSVPIQLNQDEILTIKDSTYNFIPLQQTKATQVIITTEEEPSKAGIYAIEKSSEFIENVSYNFNRDESKLIYLNPKNWENVTVYSTINDLLETISEENTINSYWKWFVIFALLFLITEMLLLKYLKN